MRKKLTAIGNSLGFVIDKPIAELYGLDRDSVVEISPLEDGFVVRIVKDKEALDAVQARSEKIRLATEKSHRKFGRVLKNLGS